VAAFAAERKVQQMQNRTMIPIFALAVGLILSSTAFAQAPEVAPGWKTCPQCLNAEETKGEAKLHPPGMPFNPRDMSGVWHGIAPSAAEGKDGGVLANTHNVFVKSLLPGGKIPSNVPKLTPYGQQLFDATRTESKAPEGTATTNTKDPMLKCDPLGWPRWFTYEYGIEFVTLPDRVIQFFEWGHAFRTIWTDGRKLPENPPEPRWAGWAVGHWEPDNTFVVESNGYDDRSWISEAGNFITKAGDGGTGKNGWPHSDEMKIVERWKRLDYATLEGQVTIIDPKVYAEPFQSLPLKHMLLPDAEIWEYFCVPSDNDSFNERVLYPGNQIPVPGAK
jgi:hypothetical protein